MHFPHFHFFEAREAKKDPQYTTDGDSVISIVYVTADPTFTGKIGGYTTLDPEYPTATSSSSSNKKSTSSKKSSSASSTNGGDAQTSYNYSSRSGYATPTPTVAVTATGADSYYGSSTGYYVSPTADPASASSSDAASKSDGGLSSGAKAGIAIAVLFIAALFLGGVLFSLRKIKKQRQLDSDNDDEKTAMAGAIPMSSTPTNSNDAKAPRLSLRPVSRIMPEFMGGAQKIRNSHGNLLTVSGGNTARTASPGPQQKVNSPANRAPEGPNPSNPFNDPQNPFADPEKGMALSGLNPTSGPAGPVGASPAATGISAGPVAGGAAGLAAVTGPPRTGHPPRMLPPPMTASSGPATSSLDPDHRPDPLAAPGPVVAQGPGGQEQPAGNVYRVQLDFKPSMSDELELVAGQLVRLLYEYDDGWALCIRLDRSQQGVVPRTCLAAKPSKPRPSHLNQYARNGPGAGGPGRPGAGPDGRMSPAVARPGAPGEGRMSPAVGRPGAVGEPHMSPPGTGSRPMSPAGLPRSFTPQQGRSPVVANFNSPRLNQPPPPPGMGTPQRSMSPAVGGRPVSPNSRSRSPGPREIGPGAFNQAPRPLSPGPRPQPKRTMSPGPYGPGGSGPQPMVDPNQRRRSNSMGAANLVDRRASPLGPSRLGPAGNSTPALLNTTATPAAPTSIPAPAPAAAAATAPAGPTNLASVMAPSSPKDADVDTKPDGNHAPGAPTMGLAL